MILCLLRMCSSNFFRYDQTNFKEIAAGSNFQVMTYTDIDPAYKVPTPPGGKGSGGAFVFDIESDSCMEFTLERAPSLTIDVSFWCDLNLSKLRLETTCTYTTLQLCDRRIGRWNLTRWKEDCDPWGSVSGLSSISCDSLPRMPISGLGYNRRT